MPIKQVITTKIDGEHPSSSSLTIFNDIILEEPILVGISIFTNPSYVYTDGQKICSLYLGMPVYLKWNVVPDATHYVVQICRNSNFIGPTLRTQKIVAPTTQAEFYAGQNPSQFNLFTFLSVETEYFWRVMALSNVGGAGPKSEVWSFMFSCSQYLNSNEVGSGSSGSSSSGSSGECNCPPGFQFVDLINPETLAIECIDGNVSIDFETKRACVKVCES